MRTGTATRHSTISRRGGFLEQSLVWVATRLSDQSGLLLTGGVGRRYSSRIPLSQHGLVGHPASFDGLIANMTCIVP